MAKYLLLKHYRGAAASVNDVPIDQWSPNATTSRDRPHGSTRSCGVERGRQAFTDPTGTVYSPCWLAGPRYLPFKRPISRAPRS
jgi:hypothetical protein